jgi:phosphoenolpyruvate carboxylase
LGLNALSKTDLALIKSVYVNFEADLKDALAYANFDTGLIPKELQTYVDSLGIAYQVHAGHAQLTGEIAKAITHNRTESVAQNLLRAASIRRFLG